MSKPLWKVMAMAALASTLLSAAAAEIASPCQRGREFLVSLIDPELNLLPEFRGTHVFWLFHDNYLAAKVLRATHPELAEKIRSAIRKERVTKSGKIEIVFGEAENPLPFREYELTEVRRSGDKIIRTEIVTDRPLARWENYADLLLLATIAERDKGKARANWEAAMNMWDGKGFLDAASKHNHLYATYKLGLALLAASRLSPPVEVPAAIREKLLSLQSDAGGWITDYDAAGKKIGLANVETTCLAILGLEAAAGNN